MKNIAKQKRSKKRVEIILQTAKTIIENKGVDNLTIAEIAKESGLKGLQHINLYQQSNL